MVGATIELTASDGHRFGAYEVKPEGGPRGGLVIVQEIFGVNAHIRWVADGFAADGYHVIAPALFDRAERGVEIGYEAADVERGRNLHQKISLDEMLLDISACGAALVASGKVGLVGYCLGGSLAWLTATRLDGFAAADGYYGGMVAAHLDELPRIPVMLHFGEEDGGIPIADVAKIRTAADPALVQVFTYPDAGHAFNRDGNKAWHESSAKRARERTLSFLQERVG